MFRKQIIAESPLRILDASLHNGLEAGNLGVIMARAGVGKTACLIQFALHDMLQERKVLHVAVGQGLDHVQAWYDALFEDLAEHSGLQAQKAEVRREMWQARIIHTYGSGDFSSASLDDLVRRLTEHAGFRPDTILIDDLDWDRPVDEMRALVAACKDVARRAGAELWMTAQIHRDQVGATATGIAAPCDVCADQIDVGIFLEPHSSHVHIVLVKDHDNLSPLDTNLCLHADTLRIARDEVSDAAVRIPSRASTLLSGGAAGSEEAFGILAERYGLREVNFSFDGREVARKRGLRMLTEAELERGAASGSYVQRHLRRNFSDPDHTRKVMHSIWHQVNAAGEVFQIGTVRPDGSVKGGTGWAVELARHWRKPVYVFDQTREVWLSWREGAWHEIEAPIIRRSRFCGTGTRSLNDAGRAAVESLFERSFG